MGDPCVVGLDVGGTHSRALLATVGGRVLGTGRAGGGNPTVLGAEPAIANIVAALRAALGNVPGDRVEACVVGLAGVSTLIADPKGPGTLERAWADAGLSCPVRIVSDVTVAFAAGTPRPDGTLLVSGTGAVAARMHDRLPARFRDGYGWLLGDDGSGFWIGRQAARAAIAAVDGRAPMAELAKAVLEALLEPASAQSPDAGVDSRSTSGKESNTAGEEPLGAAIGEGFAVRGRRRAAELVRAVAAQPTVALASLAPLVMAAYELGDPAAQRIVEGAARVLVESLDGVGPVPGEPVVLGGSVLVSRGPVFEAVAAAARRRWPDSPLGLARDGAAGAGWLAARDLLGDEAAAPVHVRFTGDDRSSAKFS
ncbi:MAG: ATPase [Catenulispora sp.]|nr:ATPase [Catenulispora sp.]